MGDSGVSTRRAGSSALVPIAALAVLVGVVIIGARAGNLVLGPAALERLQSDLQQTQTSTGTYVGRLSQDGDYLVLRLRPS